MLVREDASVPSLAPLYLGPYLVLELQTKFSRLQLGDKTDVYFVDRLKPAFSEVPISPAFLHPRGLPALKPILRAVPTPCQPPLMALLAGSPSGSTFLLRFLLDKILIVQHKIEGSALPFLLGGVLWQI